MTLKCYGNNVASFRDKIKSRLFFQKLLDAILLSAALAITKIPEHSKLDFWKAKGNHLADISAK